MASAPALLYFKYSLECSQRLGIGTSGCAPGGPGGPEIAKIGAVGIGGVGGTGINGMVGTGRDLEIWKGASPESRERKGRTFTRPPRWPLPKLLKTRRAPLRLRM